MQTVAFVFPGQGSQAIGMLSELAEAFPIVQKSFDEASEVLGYDLWECVQQGPAEKLNQTQITQPAILTASVAVWRIWLERDNFVKPCVLAGHSLGEYSALVCAETLAFDDAVALVAKRGEFMQQAVPAGEGAMAAIIGLTPSEIETLCQAVATADPTSKQFVTAANYNSPVQTVIAGHVLGVEAVMAEAKANGAKRAVRLPMSVPSHCQLMAKAADALSTQMETITFHSPQIPVIHNVDLTVQSDPAAIRQRLVSQLCQPVRWVETVEQIIQAYAPLVIECGPGKALTGLNKRINSEGKYLTLNSPTCFENVTAELAELLQT